MKPIDPDKIEKGMTLYTQEGCKVNVEIIWKMGPGKYETVVIHKDGSAESFSVDLHFYDDDVPNYLPLYRKNPRSVKRKRVWIE